MHCGTPTLCLSAKELEASRRFYEALGLEVIEDVPSTRVVLRRGSFTLALMPFLEETWLNFRGADVLAVHAALRDAGIAGEGRPERYVEGQHGADADGVCWRTRDPDGNVVFFDTNRNEEGEAYRSRRVREILEGAERDLIDAGAGPDLLRALRAEVIARAAPREG